MISSKYRCITFIAFAFTFHKIPWTTADFELRSQLGCNLQYLIIVRLERLALEGNDQFQSISCVNTKQCTYIENIRSDTKNRKKKYFFHVLYSTDGDTGWKSKLRFISLNGIAWEGYLPECDCGSCALNIWCHLTAESTPDKNVLASHIT